MYTAKNIALILTALVLGSFKANYQNTQDSYMTAEETSVLELLNQVRTNPSGFEKNVIAQKLKKDPKNTYLKSLSNTLKTMSPVSALSADQSLYNSAQCHANEIGEKGLRTHDRQSKNCKNLNVFKGECISFGYNSANKILLQLLIDEGIADLGHRNICLSSKYTMIGVKISKHKKQKHCAVLDFGY